jgi:uncharacterized coiled-coil protein SlyX
MMDQVTYWMTAIVVSTLAFLVSLATYLRTGDWKRSEAGKETHSRIEKLEGRLAVAEVRMEDLPKAADIATLSAEVEALQDDVKLIRSGITRIEDYLLRSGK